MFLRVLLEQRAGDGTHVDGHPGARALALRPFLKLFQESARDAEAQVDHALFLGRHVFNTVYTILLTGSISERTVADVGLGLKFV